MAESGNEKNGSTAAEAATGTAVDDAQKKSLVMKQIEHYFGDYNLPRDRFLLGLVKENEGGWIDLETMLKFKRLASITTDQKFIADTIKEASDGFIQVHDSELKIRRDPLKPVPEFNDERKKMLQEQTVYMKGFDKISTTMDQLFEYFEEYDNVLNVHMRTYIVKKTKEKGFKGSVFVTFKDRESAEKFMEGSIKPLGSTTDFIRKWQNDYFEEKKKEGKLKVWAEKEKIRSAKEENSEEPAAAVTAASEDEGLPKGCVLCLNGFGDDTSREDIIAVLESEFGVNRSESIAFIYFQRGEADAKIRFKVENAAVDLMLRMKEKCPEGMLSVKEADVKYSILEGSEEDEFLKKCLEDLKQRGRNKAHKRRGGFRGGRGGKRGRF